MTAVRSMGRAHVVSEAEMLLAEIARLYRELQALPIPDHPDGARRKGESAAYTALIARIRTLADRHWILVDAPRS